MSGKGLESYFPDAVAEVKGFGIFMLDTNGIIQTWNLGCEIMKGFTAEEAIGQNFEILFPDYLREKKLPENERQYAKETGRYESENWRRKKNGELFWAFVVLTRVLDEEGNHIGFIKVTQDQTDKKQYFEQLQHSNEDLRHFAHVVSHDLKEPVRKIKTFNNRILEDFKDQLHEQAKFYLNKIGGAADRMDNMIDGILEYSQLSNSKNSLKQVNFNKIVESIQSDLEVLIAKKDATIIKTVLPTVVANETLIYQLFYNLILNALKFAKACEPSKIDISSELIRQNETDVEKIILSDNGIGFEQDYADAIFDPFTRLNSKDDYEGTGLGLALCKKIVERHGGTISATGELDKGASFTILLPHP